MNLDKRFQANAAYPGQQIGMDLNGSRAANILARKIYGQEIRLNSGSNLAIDINIPRDGRLICGLSLYMPYAGGTDNPTFTLNVNNTIFIQSVGFRTIDVNTLQSSQYYEILIPLSGNDRVTLDVQNVVGNPTVYFQFYYQ
jgi:hypothetical protein